VTTTLMDQGAVIYYLDEFYLLSHCKKSKHRHKPSFDQ